ncbi:lipid A biosynthesis acyltransferase [Acidipila sp. EB88]|nr:lipid A biosynthesis acyltransferase [Acidipila sp. EB88]
MRQRLEYWFVRCLIGAMGALPRRLARTCGAVLGGVALRTLPRLRRTGEQNLVLAYPECGAAWRAGVLRKVYRSLGWQLAEFCQMASYSAEQASAFIRYEGFEHFAQAEARGKGVLIVTGHLGAWELSSFFHSLMGHPMSMVIRRLDNPYVDHFVNRVRCMHGNSVLHKDDFARGLLAATRAGRSIGILMDTNMTPPQGVFVPFFGHLACTPAGLARIALKTGAAVLPGFLLWHEDESKYVLHFYPEIEMADTGNAEADALCNTARCTAAIEAAIRAYPEQWLWVHRRWKTRPAGEAPIY